MKNKLLSLPISIGLLIWIGLFLIKNPVNLFQISYVHLLIIAAPLWIIPMAWKLTDTPAQSNKLLLPAALSFSIAFVVKKGFLAGLLTLPWLLLVTVVAILKLKTWLANPNYKTFKISELAAYLYLPIGAIWALADRLDYPLMGFDATIILLTVAHFHYAGFVLPIITAQLGKHYPSLLPTPIAWGVILGIPLVAFGITTTHFNLPVWLETVAVTVMAISALVVGGIHIKIGIQHIQSLTGKMWLLAGLALSIGMALAFCYGWRHYFTIEFLSIPWMYAVHGTLNSIGFALFGVLAWRLFSPNAST